MYSGFELWRHGKLTVTGLAAGGEAATVALVFSDDPIGWSGETGNSDPGLEPVARDPIGRAGLRLRPWLSLQCC